MLKFQENLFIADMINQENTMDPISKVEKALGYSQEESKDSGRDQENPGMQNSFYRREGLDYLSFQRPGT